MRTTPSQVVNLPGYMDKNSIQYCLINQYTMIYHRRTEKKREITPFTTRYTKKPVSENTETGLRTIFTTTDYSIAVTRTGTLSDRHSITPEHEGSVYLYTPAVRQKK